MSPFPPNTLLYVWTVALRFWKVLQYGIVGSSYLHNENPVIVLVKWCITLGLYLVCSFVTEIAHNMMINEDDTTAAKAFALPYFVGALTGFVTTCPFDEFELKQGDNVITPVFIQSRIDTVTPLPIAYLIKAEDWVTVALLVLGSYNIFTLVQSDRFSSSVGRAVHMTNYPRRARHQFFLFNLICLFWYYIGLLKTIVYVLMSAQIWLPWMSHSWVLFSDILITDGNHRWAFLSSTACYAVFHLIWGNRLVSVSWRLYLFCMLDATPNVTWDPSEHPRYNEFAQAFKRNGLHNTGFFKDLSAIHQRRR